MANYPALLQFHQPMDELRVFPPSTTIWRVRRSRDTNLLVRDPGPAETQLGTVSHLASAEQLARRATGHTVLDFAPHPLLSPILPLWGSTSGLRTRLLRPLLQSAARGHATEETTARSQRSHDDHPEIASALAALTWKAIHKLQYSSSRQRLLLHQVKGLRLSGYDLTQQRRGCLYCTGVATNGGRMSHILWTCPKVQVLWRELRQRWRSLGAWRDTDSADHQRFLHSIFSLQLPATPPGVWKTPTLVKLAKNDHRATIEVYPTCSVLWQQYVLATMAVIVQWRRGMADTTSQWTTSAAKATHRATVRGAHRQLLYSFSHYKPAWHPGPRLLVDLLTIEPLPPESPAPAPDGQRARQYLLFFDGGSRGNPGPGGAGAVIVVVDERHVAPSVVWSASMSYVSPTTTNNLAEYWGVVTGLSAAKAHDYCPLEVIGDSALILGQLRQSRPSISLKLLPLYAMARRLADQLDVRHWHHHLCAYNKMADHAANTAMDQSASTQTFHPTHRPAHLHLQTLLSGDFQHWQEAASMRQEPAW